MNMHFYTRKVRIVLSENKSAKKLIDLRNSRQDTIYLQRR